MRQAKLGLGLALVLALPLSACAPKIGPRPLLSQMRASAADATGTATVWGRVRVHFKDAKPGATPKQLMEKLNEEVTFEVEVGGSKERYIPALVPSSVETAKTTDATWRDQLTVDFLLFPVSIGKGPFRLIATDYYQSAEDEPSSAELLGAERRSLPRITRVELAPADGGKQRITAVLDRDAPAEVTLWHHLDGRVWRMERKGSRIFTSDVKVGRVEDHKVVMAAGEDWVSPPAALPGARPKVEEEKSEVSSEE